MNNETQLLRQVHPSFVQNGTVTSQVFRPTPKDEAKLSVYDGDQISAKAAYDHFTSSPSCKSMGVLAVTVDECAQQNLQVQPDPATFPEHVLVDFSPMSKKQAERAAKALRGKAEERGWLFKE